MNKRQKLVQEAFLNNEEAVISRLKQVYNQSLKDIEKKAKELQDRINELDTLAKLAVDADEKAKLLSMKQAKVYQKQYQDALKKQVSSILDNMQVEEFKTVSKYLNKCYEEGFLGTMYDLHGQGIPLVIPLDQEAMVRAVQLDSKISEGLYSRLGEDVTLLKKKIIAQVSRGIATGRTFQQVAQQLAGYTNIGYNNAVRIARTEGHRIQVQSAMDACYKAKDKGANIVKQWDSTMDSRTRPSHQKVDGEIRELDEPFSNNLMFPGDPSGGAAEVVNCRCALLQRAKLALDEKELETLKERAEFFGLDKTDNFEDFKEKYLQGVEEINCIEEYRKTKDKYNKDIKKLETLEKEVDELLDKYMDALDTPNEEKFEKLHSEKYDELESFKEIVKDLKAELAGREAKAIRHIEKNLANILGVDSSNINMTGLPYDSADMIYKSYKVVLNKYPELKGHLTQFDCDSNYGSYAGCNAISGKVVAHAKFKNYNDIVKSYANDVAKKFHPVGTDHNSIIVHELGHALDGYMTKKRMLGGKITAYGTIRSSTETKKQVLDNLGWNFEKNKKIRESLKAKGLQHREIIDEIEKQRNEFIKEKISEYACKNEKEFFAECFAEYIMSDNPREAARVFGEIIDKALGR